LATGKFFWYVFIIFLTLNLMCFYGVMGVYITPDLIVGTVLSAFFYGFWCACVGRDTGLVSLFDRIGCMKVPA
jgi:hypothetical protein